MNRLLFIFLSSFVFFPTLRAASIIDVVTASNHTIVVIVETSESEATPSQDLGQWKIDNNSPLAVGRRTDVWKTVAAIWPDNDLTLRHRIYLQLNQALVNNQSYVISTPYGNQNFLFDDQQTLCESIKVNQVGYFGLTNNQEAIFGIQMGDLGSTQLTTLPTFEVIDVSTNQVEKTGQLIYWGDDTETDPQNLIPLGSGEFIYQIDLSNLPKPARSDGQAGGGEKYFIRIPGFGRSLSFGIGSDFSAIIDSVHFRGLYHQRCGIALQNPYTQHTRAICHNTVEVTDALPYNFDAIYDRGPSIPMTGGYHDAADFDRRPIHTIIPAWMFCFYEAFPLLYDKKNYNIPESNNQMPDWLDEALWGTLVWENLQDSTGGIRAGIEADRHPDYGVVNAATDNLIYRTYGKHSYTTAVGAGLFAHAARLIRPYDNQKANDLLGKAQAAWNYVNESRPDTVKDAHRMYASLQLYLETGDNLYHDTFKVVTTRLLDNYFNGDAYPQQYSPYFYNLFNGLDGMIFSPYFFSYLITDRSVDATLQQRIIDTFLDPVVVETLDELSNQAYPVGPAPILAFGSGTNQGRYAEALILKFRLNQDSTLLNPISRLANYSLGLNPLGKSYVTGLGHHTPNDPLHLDSYFTRQNGQGNVPGIVLFGQTQQPSSAVFEQEVANAVYPSWNTLSEQRRHTDGWAFIQANEFSTYETMVQNICMYGFLAGLDKKETVVASNELDYPNTFNLSVFPNPSSESFVIDFQLQNHANLELNVFDIQGRKVATVFSGHLPQGEQQMIWNRRDGNNQIVEAGLYILSFQIGSSLQSLKMMIID